MEATAEKIEEKKEALPLVGGATKKAEPAKEEVDEEPEESEEAAAEDAEKTAEEAKPEQPAIPKGPVFISSEDRLRAENLNQKKLIAAQQISILQLQLQDAVRRSQDIEQDMARLQVELEKKYEVNFNTHDIRPGDGMVVPKNPAAAAFTQRMMGQ